jgi:hypothetical protein
VVGRDLSVLLGIPLDPFEGNLAGSRDKTRTCGLKIDDVSEEWRILIMKCMIYIVE